MWDYLTLPFMLALPSVILRELPSYRPLFPASDEDKEWRVLEATFPAEIPTHDKLQKFYFGAESLMLKRLDYDAVVINGLKPKGDAAHLVFDHKEVAGGGGLKTPFLRRIVGIDGEGRVQEQGSSLILLDFIEAKVEEEES